MLLPNPVMPTNLIAVLLIVTVHCAYSTVPLYFPEIILSNTVSPY